MAMDMFLKIDTIDGESTDSKHQNWIEILSFSHGMTQSSAGSRSTSGAGTAGRTDHQDFSIIKQLDKASPKLALACCTGTHIPAVTLALHRATGDKQKFMEYKMTDVVVSSVRPSANAHGDAGLPLEEVSFNYAKIEWIYTETDHQTGKPKGDVKASWSLAENKGA